MRQYSTRDAADLLGIPPSTVRAYARTVHLQPDRHPGSSYRFSFQDLLVLRSAGRLAQAHVSPRRIHRALRDLAGRLPGRALTEVEMFAEGARVVVKDGEATWEAGSGQGWLDFAGRTEATRVAQFPRPGPTAEEWFALGREREARRDPEAREAYRRCLTCDPGHADAHVNLGRLLHAEGDAAAAAEHYRAALAIDRDHGTAAFNLGCALESMGRRGEAIAAYGQAVAAHPELADAHYNLALLYELIGERAAAVRHLTAYRGMAKGGRSD